MCFSFIISKMILLQILCCNCKYNSRTINKRFALPVFFTRSKNAASMYLLLSLRHKCCDREVIKLEGMELEKTNVYR